METTEIRDTKTNPVKVIREKCLECCCNQWTEVEKCTVKICPLHPWRFGKNPYRKKRELTDEQKETLKVQLGNARKTVAGEIEPHS